MNPQVFVKPADKTLEGTPNMNLLAKLLRKQPNFSRVVSEEGFDINPVGWIWEWSIHLKGTPSFLVLHERGTELYAYFYLTGKEYLETETFRIPVDTIGEYEASSFMMLLGGLRSRIIKQSSYKPQPTTYTKTGSNYTKPKKKRK